MKWTNVQPIDYASAFDMDQVLQPLNRPLVSMRSADKVFGGGLLKGLGRFGICLVELVVPVSDMSHYSIPRPLGRLSLVECRGLCPSEPEV